MNLCNVKIKLPKSPKWVSTNVNLNPFAPDIDKMHPIFEQRVKFPFQKTLSLRGTLKLTSSE